MSIALSTVDIWTNYYVFHLTYCMPKVLITSNKIKLLLNATNTLLALLRLDIAQGDGIKASSSRASRIWPQSVTAPSNHSNFTGPAALAQDKLHLKHKQHRVQHQSMSIAAVKTSLAGNKPNVNCCVCAYQVQSSVFAPLWMPRWTSSARCCWLPSPPNLGWISSHHPYTRWFRLAWQC